MKTKIQKLVTILSLLTSIVMITLSQQAQAGAYRTCEGNRPLKWQKNVMLLQVSNQHFPIRANATDPDNLRQAFLNAVTAWNEAPGVSLSIGVSYRDAVNTRHPFNYVDGINTVSINRMPDMGDAIGYAHKRWRCGREFGIAGPVLHYIVEADIFFAPATPWTNAPYYHRTSPLWNPRNGTNLSLVAIHEIGHAIGIEHDDGIIQTMNSIYPNGGPLGQSGYGPGSIKPHVDDIFTARIVYGGGDTVADLLEVTNFRMQSTAGRSNARETRVGPFAQNDIYSMVPIPIMVENRGSVNEGLVKGEYFLSDTPPTRNPDGSVTFGPKIRYLTSNRYAANSPGFTRGVSTQTVLFDHPVGDYYLGIEIKSINSVVTKQILISGTLADGRIRITPYVPHLLSPAVGVDKCMTDYGRGYMGTANPAYTNCLRNAVAYSTIFFIDSSSHGYFNKIAKLSVLGYRKNPPDKVEVYIGPYGGGFQDASLIDTVTTSTIDSFTRMLKFTPRIDTTKYVDDHYIVYAVGYVAGRKMDTYSSLVVFDNTPPMLVDTTNVASDQHYHGLWFENMGQLKTRDEFVYYDGQPLPAVRKTGTGSRLAPNPTSGTWTSNELVTSGLIRRGTAILTDEAGNTCTPGIWGRTSAGHNIICQ